MRKMSIIALNTKKPIMSYQYKREPFSNEEADWFANTAENHAA